MLFICDCAIYYHRYLDWCYEMLINSSCDSVQTVCEYSFPPFRALTKNLDNSLRYYWPEFTPSPTSRSQDLPYSVHDAGQCYFFNLEQYPGEGKILGYNISRDSCMDIDTQEDFEIAEKLHRIKFK